jgi:uncharacterized CHY-type Zn-finger protein
MTSTSGHVRGIDLDPQTRCLHYHGPADIIAIKMKCCGVYYACKDCHIALADHPIEAWPEGEWCEPAILCGACGTELTIRQYMQSESLCPGCRARFNPGCRNHYHFYFAIPQGQAVSKGAVSATDPEKIASTPVPRDMVDRFVAGKSIATGARSRRKR